MRPVPARSQVELHIGEGLPNAALLVQARAVVAPTVGNLDQLGPVGDAVHVEERLAPAGGCELLKACGGQGCVRLSKLPLDKLVTDRFRLDQINEAAEALIAGNIRGRAIIEF